MQARFIANARSTIGNLAVHDGSPQLRFSKIPAAPMPPPTHMVTIP
jgi:hypothetical protein